jgi:hypothetical protein
LLNTHPEEEMAGCKKPNNNRNIGRVSDEIFKSHEDYFGTLFSPEMWKRMRRLFFSNMLPPDDNTTTESLALIEEAIIFFELQRVYPSTGIGVV